MLLVGADFLHLFNKEEKVTLGDFLLAHVGVEQVECQSDDGAAIEVAGDHHMIHAFQHQGRAFEGDGGGVSGSVFHRGLGSWRRVPS